MSLITELRRRNVFRVGLFYIVSAWLVVQVAETLLPIFEVPDGVLRGIVLALVLGFVPALVFAWAFELTPEGLRRERGLEEQDAPTKQQTAQKLNWATLIAAMLAIGLLLADRMLPELDTSPGVATTAPNSSESAAPESTETAAPKSIAVLPFSDFSPGGDSQWFADGLSEEILNSLVRVPDLLVAARTSSFSFRDSNRPIPEIATELGVAHVLEGSVRMGGDRVRVTAQLIRAEDGFHVWSDTFDREMADMISIQEELAREIARAMETTMDPDALTEMSDVGTRSVEAYQAYLRGRGIAEFGGNPEAYALFEQARQIDPDFSRAHFLAARYWQIQSDTSRIDLVETGLTAEEMAARFIERIDAAIASESSEVQRLLYRGLKARFELRLREAKEMYEAYVAQRPGEMDAWFELLQIADIMDDDAAVLRGMQALRTRVEEAPAYAANLPSYGYRLSDPQQAATEVRRSWPLLDRWPLAPNLHYQMHRALLWIGDAEGARRVHDRIFQTGLAVPNPALVRLRQACAEGKTQQARTLFDETISEEMNERWLALFIMGEEEAANEVLRPLDRSGNLYALSAYLVYPHFDVDAFPALQALLEEEGIERDPSRSIPFRCDRPELQAESQ